MGTRSPDGPDQSQATKGRKPAPREASCRVQVGSSRELRRGTAALGEDALNFHTGRTGRQGRDFSLQLRYDELTQVVVDAHAGTLTVATAEAGPYVFHLGRHAGDWKRMISERPSPLGNLGLRRTSRVAVEGIDDEEILRELAARVPGYGAEDRLDFLFVGAGHKADLGRLGALAARLGPAGIVYVVYERKGRGVSARDVAAAAREAGLLVADELELTRTLDAVTLHVR